MNCLVCGANAEQTSTTMAGMTIVCPTCGEYDISSAVLATDKWQRFGPEERLDVLDEAKQSVQPGAARPMITMNLIAADIAPDM